MAQKFWDRLSKHRIERRAMRLVDRSERLYDKAERYAQRARKARLDALACIDRMHGRPERTARDVYGDPEVIRHVSGVV